MLSSIEHRGPDDVGSFVRESADVMMGARRLAIVDLTGGDQPISNENGDVTVVFNGEIYNYDSLRSTLEAEGHRFETDCDTEVLVHAWEEYSQSMVDRLEGMFAFSIWDDNEEILFLARDRLGIKPLYYAADDSNFVWSSEIASLLEAGVKPTVDERAVYNYFTFKYTPWPQTLLANVRKVPPGTALTVTEEGVTEHDYWNLTPDTLEASPSTVADRIRDELERAVERRLMADVPVGAFLSGGIDSSAIVGLMSRRVTDLKTFSIGFESAEHDESDEAAFVADYFGTDHHEITVDLDSMDLFPRMIQQYGEPMADPAILPTMALADHASDYVKVVLSGTGADEVFAGYNHYREYPRHQRSFGRIPARILRAVGRVAPYAPAKREHLSYLGSLASPEEGFLHHARAYDRDPGAYLDTDHDAESAGAQACVDSTFAVPEDGDLVKQMSTFDLTYWLPDDLLYKVDHATMASSLEARVPFLDHQFVQFAYNIPSEYKVANDEYKPILKRAVSDILPERIHQREKHGLSVPIAEWFREGHEAIEGVLTEDAVERTPYLDADALFSLWRRHRRGNANNCITLWKALNYVAWYEEYCILDGTRTQAPIS
jgi:asparagine synthase (glutamine-hydrolysing)